MIVLSCNVSKNADEDSSGVTISITSPEDQSTVNDSVLIQCQSNNDDLVSKIELWVDGDSTGVHDLTSPFSIIWDTRVYENGVHSFLFDHMMAKKTSLTVRPLLSPLVIFLFFQRPLA